MPNYSAKILGTAISGIRTHQAVIANTGNNIANVNTPGYSRRTVSLENVSGGVGGGLNIGGGVDVTAIQRQVDVYLNRQLLDAKGEQASADMVSNFVSRIDNLFNLTSDQATIGSSLTSFFNAANDLAVNPSSIELRQNFLLEAQGLIDSIKNTYNSLAALQDEADNRIVTEVDTVNSLTSQIADLNGRITTVESSGAAANDERDQRDQLLEQLGQKLTFSQIQLPDGSVTITLENGFALVTGTSTKQLSVTENPSFGTSPLPESLSGGHLNYIVYDYSNGAGTQQLDFTNFLKNQNGTIGGLLKVRGYVDPAIGSSSPFNADGHIVDVAKRVESITQALLGAVNQTYLGPDQDAGTAGHQPSAEDLDGNPPATYGLFTFDFSGTRDVNGNGLPDDLGNHNIANYSSRLSLTSLDPRDVAAARDLTGVAALAPGDGSNINAIAAMSSQSMTFSAPGFSLTGTFDNAYQEAVTTVSNKASRALLDVSMADSKAVSLQTQRDSVSAVSLEEEFTNLITSQKAFEASARMIRTAQEMLDTILNIL